MWVQFFTGPFLFPCLLGFTSRQDLPHTLPFYPFDTQHTFDSIYHPDARNINPWPVQFTQKITNQDTSFHWFAILGWYIECTMRHTGDIWEAPVPPPLHAIASKKNPKKDAGIAFGIDIWAGSGENLRSNMSCILSIGFQLIAVRKVPWRASEWTCCFSSLGDCRWRLEESNGRRLGHCGMGSIRVAIPKLKLVFDCKSIVNHTKCLFVCIRTGGHRKANWKLLTRIMYHIRPQSKTNNTFKSWIKTRWRTVGGCSARSNKFHIKVFNLLLRKYDVNVSGC